MDFRPDGRSAPQPNRFWRGPPPASPPVKSNEPSKTSLSLGIVANIIGYILSVLSYLIVIVKLVTPAESGRWTYYDIFHEYYPYFSQGTFIFFQKIMNSLLILLLISILLLIFGSVILKKRKVITLIFLILDLALFAIFGAGYIFINFIFD